MLLESETECFEGTHRWLV